MKKQSWILVLSLMMGTVHAQNTSYKILHDKAEKPWLSLNLEILNLGMGISNFDGLYTGLGFYGFIDPIDKAGMEFGFRKSFLTSGQLGFREYDGNTDFELGGHYFLLDQIRKKDTKIVLKREYGGTSYSTNVSGDRVATRSETVTYIMVPARRRVMTGVRGGLISGSGPYSISDKDDLFPSVIEGNFNLSNSGVYLGLIRRSLRNVYVDVEEYGINYNSAGFDFFADVLLMPASSLEVLSLDASNALLNANTIDETLDESSLGFRLGFSMYQIAPKKQTGKMFGFAAKGEAGIRPYQGIYIAGGLSITLIKAQSNPFQNK